MAALYECKEETVYTYGLECSVSQGAERKGGAGTCDEPGLDRYAPNHAEPMHPGERVSEERMGLYSVHALESFGDKPRRPWVNDTLCSFTRSNGDVVRSAAGRTPEKVVCPRKPSDWSMNSGEAQRDHLQCGKKVDGGRPGCVIAYRKGTTKPRRKFGERVSADPCH